jgi:hypothetical protein
MNSRHLVLALVLPLLITACKKYDDGPGLSLRSKKERVANTWTIDKYFLNGVDATHQLVISSYQETYSKSGELNRSYIDSDGDLITQAGTWEFNTKKEKLDISGVGSIELTEANSTVSSKYVEILRLKEKEFWYQYENGGATHEFHMVPK